MASRTGPAAALSAVTCGVQAQGVWTGVRQIFVRFAGEAETATLYNADRLATHVERTAEKTRVHSLSIGGSDVLGNASFVEAMFERWRPTLPIMLDCDTARPEAIGTLLPYVAMVQITVDATESAPAVERRLELLAAAAAAGRDHAAVVAIADGTSDGQILRFVEQARAAAPGMKLVVHPPPTLEKAPLDRRFGVLLEQVMAIHADVRLLIRVPPPVGMR